MCIDKPGEVLGLFHDRSGFHARDYNREKPNAKMAWLIVEAHYLDVCLELTVDDGDLSSGL